MAWFEALAGRDTARAGGDVPADAAASEARALRELIRSWQMDAELPAVPAEDLQRESELIERARAAGLLRPPRAVAVPRGWLGRGALAAAALIVMAVGVALLRPIAPPTEAVRGGGTVRLLTRDPAALKGELTRQLSAAGAHVAGFERLGRPGIDVDLPQPLSPQIREILVQHHVPVPPDGELVIEFEASGER